MALRPNLRNAIFAYSIGSAAFFAGSMGILKFLCNFKAKYISL